MNSIEGLSNTGPMRMPRPENVALTDEQKAEALQIVQKYDTETLSADDLDAMRKELKEAGIGPGGDLKTILEGEGFEVKGRGPSKGGAGGPSGPPPPKPEDEQSEEIASFLEKYESGELSSDDIDALMTLLRKQGESSKGLLLDEDA